MRTVEASEIDAWTRCMGVGFLYTVPEGYGEYFLGDVDLRRTWGAFDGERVVGTLRSFATAVHGPGPDRGGGRRAHQRHGGTHPPPPGPVDRDDHVGAPCRCAEREEPVGILIASEYPIYGRFGYGAAIEAAVVFGGPGRHPLSSGRDRGSVELVDLVTLRSEAPALYERFRARQPGSIGRDARWWDRVLHQVDVPGAKTPEGYQALYRSAAGVPEGYVRYRATQTLGPHASHRRGHRGRARGDDSRRRTSDCGATAARSTCCRRSEPATAASTSRWGGCSKTPGPCDRRVGTTSCGCGCSMSPAPWRRGATPSTGTSSSR